jgi:glutaredoxin-like protein
VSGVDRADGSADGADEEDLVPAAPTVTVYWRPGCPFCRSLRRGLHRGGLVTADLDIWSDPSAAAFVRHHADGNETVPTVDVAGTVLVNPSARRVLALAAEAGVPVGTTGDRWWRRRRD